MNKILNHLEIIKYVKIKEKSQFSIITELILVLYIQNNNIPNIGRIKIKLN